MSCDARLLPGNLRTDGTHKSICRVKREGFTQRKIILRVTHSGKSPKPLKYKTTPVLGLEGGAVPRAAGRQGRGAAGCGW